MTPGDRAAAQGQQQTIATSAQFYGYTVDSTYSYREIACPVAPNNLLLAYESTSPNGSISRFTAVVGRGAEEETAGRRPVAQIIPILHLGIVPFIPAIANPHSIEVFNSSVSFAPNAIQVLSAIQAGNQPLLVRALCYLAMVGEEPAALGSPSLDQATIHAPIPTLVFQNKGKIRQQISVRGSQNSYQVWALTFQSSGKLLTATREEHPIDRTPLALNAVNSGAPTDSTRPTVVPTSTVQIPPQPVTPMPVAAPRSATTVAAAPVAPAEPSTPSVAPPAYPEPAPAVAATLPTPPTPPANPPAVEPPTLIEPAPTRSTLELSPTTQSAKAASPVTEPVTTPLAARPASTVEPVATATSAVAAAPPPAPEPAAAVSPTPPPPATSVTPAPIPPPASAAVPAPSAAFVATPPVVKPSPPLPLGRFIPSPPQPPSRFIPDSALKTPPHLPQ